MVTINGNVAWFSFFRPGAGAAEVVIESGRGPRRVAMTAILSDCWLARATVPAGQLRFRYCVDGRWSTDPREIEVGGPAGTYSMVEVPGASRASARRGRPAGPARSVRPA